MELATEQNVPVLTVFKDSTLTDMRMKLPRSSEKMLDVSGVGRIKLQRYGKLSLGTINDFVGSLPETEIKPMTNDTAYEQE